ncbi:NAD(P)H-dependent oxidoreductase subunit E, partial [Planctomycetota bacterium]
MTDININLGEIDEIISAHGTGPRFVIPILQAVQEKHNYLPEPVLRHICAHTEITPADITGVMSFYSQFRDHPAGKHFVRVCIGTACHVRGASNITDAFRRYLEIEGEEDTDREGLFTVEEVACLGCCMLAPAVQIDDLIYGFVEAQKVGQVLSDFLASREKPSGPAAADAEAGAAEVRLCQCSSCRASGADDVYQEIGRAAADLDLPIHLKTVGCTGISYQTPLVEIAAPDGEVFRYGRVTPAMVGRMLQRHVRPAGAAGRMRAGFSGLVERILTDRGREPVTRFSVDIRHGPDADYVSCQQRIATSGAGVLDPLDL